MNGQKPRARDLAFGTASGFFAFGFGSGLSPFAPGTMGTVAAIPLAVALKLLPLPLFWPLLLVLFLLGIHLCGVTSRRLGQHDPGGIVWDEMVAYWLTVAFVPLHWAWLLAAFALFRVFDIFKPWPIRRVEKRFGGGMGIMLDDIVAALYAMALLQLASVLLQSV
ncbi:MAG: phosphatidylglycerophosphatase A [Xanthomonadales bacterium]|jgi:phosphatidylglycerophosphatase A|nr:phosphatidylglycerophosphatase A [Xanthomonadales bacterium]